MSISVRAIGHLSHFNYKFVLSSKNEIRGPFRQLVLTVSRVFLQCPSNTGISLPPKICEVVGVITLVKRLLHLG